MVPHRFFGVGIEWTESLEEGILENLDKLDCVELIPENFFYDRSPEFIRALAKAGTPVMIHAVEMSVATDEPFKEEHFEKILRVADRVNTIDFSDHLCMTEAGGVEIGQLTPFPWTRYAADVVCRKIEQIQKRISVPFLIENIAYRFIVPNTEMTEPEFINLVLKRTGCELLLDLHNLHANAENFGFNPYEWMAQLDLSRVSAVHLAGGFYDDEGTLVDGHSDPVPERAWGLYEILCRQVKPACTIVERTERYPKYPDLADEVIRARSILLGENRMNLLGVSL